MKEKSNNKVSSKNEFEFASSSILLQVARGIVVGLIVGAIVGSFRLLIEEAFHMLHNRAFIHLYHLAKCEINTF